MTDDPFEYKYPIPFPSCYQAGEGPEIDYEFYQDSDYIKVAELIGMLLDPYCEKNEYVKDDKPEEWKELHNNLQEYIFRGLESGNLKAFNYSPKKNNNQKVNFWTIELVPSSIGSWLNNKNIIKQIEAIDIKVSAKFKELIQNYTSKQEPSFNKLELDDINSSSEQYVFRQDNTGEIVELAFNGKKGHIKFYKGLKYIQILLKHPLEKISAKKLNKIVNYDAGSTNFKEGDISDLGLEEDENPKVDGYSSEPILDKQGLILFNKKIKEIEIEINTLEQSQNPGHEKEIEKLKEDKDSILKDIKNNTYQGKPKSISDSGEKTKKAVCEAISFGKKQIEENHPALYKHLEAHITTGYDCRYDPPPDNIPNWVFD